MEQLNIETGLVEYDINNGACKISFNPTDAVFINKLYIVFDELDKRQKAYQSELKKTKDSKALFETLEKIDVEMRDLVNDVFGFDICTTLFGRMNIFAMADGFPVWANLLITILDISATKLEEQTGEADEKIKKYTEKYRKK